MDRERGKHIPGFGTQKRAPRKVMRNIAVLSSDQDLNDRIQKIVDPFDEDFNAIFLGDRETFVQYLNYELPEIDIINYRAEVDETLEIIKHDPWLHFGGSIVIFDHENEEELFKRLGGVNIVALIQKARLESYLPKVLQVLRENRSILFQRDIHALLQSNLSGTFEIENDPFEASVYSNLIANFLFNSNLIGLEKKENFYAALMELIINAIEHGNCRVTYEEKKAYLRENSDAMRLISEKNLDPEIQKKRVHVTYRITPRKSAIKIRDEGDGFDWRAYENEYEVDVDQLHGRGIMMARHYLSRLTYNDRGNEVSFEIDHIDEVNVVPRVFTNMEEVSFEDGQVVFQQGEKSSHLFYIISGEFNIIANGRVISTLTPADIFLGEMSFLLNNRRSATVVTVGRGVCIRISKEAFINAIKEQPHYGIFLARLLAQRLDQIHEITL